MIHILCFNQLTFAISANPLCNLHKRLSDTGHFIYFDHAKMKMVSFWTLSFVLCMCWARSSFSSLNNTVRSEPGAMFEEVKKIINEISAIHSELETENQELKNIVFQLQIELT